MKKIISKILKFSKKVFSKKRILIPFSIILFVAFACAGDFLYVNRTVAYAKKLSEQDFKIVEQSKDRVNTNQLRKERITRIKTIVKVLERASKFSLGLNLSDVNNFKKEKKFLLKNSEQEYDILSNLELAEKSYDDKNISTAFKQADYADKRIANDGNIWRFERYKAKLIKALSKSQLTSETNYKEYSKILFEEVVSLDLVDNDFYIRAYYNYSFSCLQFEDYKCVYDVSNRTIQKHINNQKIDEEETKKLVAYIYFYKAAADFEVNKQDEIKSDVEKSLSYYAIEEAQKYYDENFKNNRTATKIPTTTTSSQPKQSQTNSTTPVQSQQENPQEKADRDYYNAMVQNYYDGNAAIAKTQNGTWKGNTDGKAELQAIVQKVTSMQVPNNRTESHKLFLDAYEYIVAWCGYWATCNLNCEQIYNKVLCPVSCQQANYDMSKYNQIINQALNNLTSGK